MSVLSAKNLSKSFGGEQLFDQVSFDIYETDKVALVGKNGVGKTTLLKMILGQEEYDSGDLAINRKLKIGYLSQKVITSLENTLIDEVNLVFDEVKRIGEKMENLSLLLKKDPHNEGLLEEYGRLENRFLHLGGYNYRYQLDMILSKFKFDPEDYNRPISTFSGGEQTKIAFAKLLLEEHDVLILDEPTNHLDLSTIEFLEGYLKQFQGSVILVSHDRYFVDAIVNKVFELENNGVQVYNGNFSYYVVEKQVRYEHLLKEYYKQQEEIAKLEDFVARNKVRATTASRAKSKEKALEKIERIEKPTNYEEKVRFKIKSALSRYEKMITVDDVSVGYEHPLMEHISFNVSSDDKIAIIGDNGVGKTTFLKVLKQDRQVLGGTIKYHHSLKIGYFDQTQMSLDDTLTIFEEVHASYPHLDELAIRSHLALFLFKGEDVFKSIKGLSGGERVRLVFAKLLLKQYDLLLLDEPTNHLDLSTKKILEDALSAYEGAIIFISHDRYLIQTLANKIAHFEKDKFTYFEGTYDAYKEKLLSEQMVIDEKKQEIKNEKKQSKLSNNRVKYLETTIHKTEEKLEELKQSLFLESVYSNHVLFNEVQTEITENELLLEKLYEEYLN